MHAPAQQVPGRLRLRFTQLKQQTRQLERMAASLHAVGGVIAVETSPITGGLLIHFDALIGNTPAFWDQVEAVLHSYQLLVDPRPLARRNGGPPPRPPASEVRQPTPSSDPEHGPKTRRGHPAIRNAHPVPAMGAARSHSPAPVNPAPRSSAGVGTLGKSHPAVNPACPLPPLRPTPRTVAAQRTLSRPGSAVPWPQPPVRQACKTEGASLGRKLAGGIASALVDRLIERSAIALVAALL